MSNEIATVYYLSRSGREYAETVPAASAGARVRDLRGMIGVAPLSVRSFTHKTCAAPSPVGVLPVSAEHAEALAVAEHRRANPRSRAPRAIVIGRNGSRSKSLRNALTGELSPTWDTHWPITRKVVTWAEEQRRAMFGEWSSCA